MLWHHKKTEEVIEELGSSLQGHKAGSGWSFRHSFALLSAKMLGDVCYDTV